MNTPKPLQKILPKVIKSVDILPDSQLQCEGIEAARRRMSGTLGHEKAWLNDVFDVMVAQEKRIAALERQVLMLTQGNAPALITE